MSSEIYDGLCACFQGWLVDDDLRRRGVDPADAGALSLAAKFVPFYGLCAYLALRPPLPTRPPPPPPAGAPARAREELGRRASQVCVALASRHAHPPRSRH